MLFFHWNFMSFSSQKEKEKILDDSGKEAI